MPPKKYKIREIAETPRAELFQAQYAAGSKEFSRTGKNPTARKIHLIRPIRLIRQIGPAGRIGRTCRQGHGMPGPYVISILSP